MIQTPVQARRKYDESFKRQAVENWISSGKSAGVIGHELGIAPNRLYSWRGDFGPPAMNRSEEHTPELQSPCNLVCRLLLEKKIQRSRDTRTDSHGCHLQLECRAPPACGPPRSRTSLGAPWPPERSSSAAEKPFFFNDTATTEIYTLSLHDALPI